MRQQVRQEHSGAGLTGGLTARVPLHRLSRSEERLAAGLLGGLLGLALLKFGNPVILDSFVSAPADIWEWLFNPWPIRWAYWLVLPVALAGLGLIGSAKPPSVRRFWFWLPLLWFGWQCLAAADSVDSALSRATLLHFGACVAMYYAGYWALSKSGNAGPFWMLLTLSLALVLWAGLDQHFGGLESTRQSIYAQPDWREYPPDFLKRIASNRIFGTLFYPNTLAGAILLLLPLALTHAIQRTARLPHIPRGVGVGLLAYVGIACLYWTGSKAGWLIAVALVTVYFGHLPLKGRIKWTAMAMVGVAALLVFGFRFAPYFQQGATSASARLDYWQAAAATTTANPWTGTGPGTFAIPYRALKQPESEMSRMVHNDYLQQASDSGLPGGLLFLALWPGSLAVCYRRARSTPMAFAVWLGLLGFGLQGLVEFSLYIPALAWPAFILLGWLCGLDPKPLDADPPAEVACRKTR